MLNPSVIVRPEDDEQLPCGCSATLNLKLYRTDVIS